MPAEEGTVVNNDAVVETAATVSTAVENNSPILDEDGIDISFAQNDGSDDTDDKSEESTDDSQQEETEAESTEVVEETTEESEDEKSSKADQRKDQLNTEIRDLVSERNRIRAEVEQLNAEVYKPASADELVEQVNPETGEYYNRLEAKLEAMEQQRQVEQYNNQVTEQRLALTSEANRAIQDFPMFDERSEQYNPAIAAQADALLQQQLVFDPRTNQLIGANGSPYQLYATIAQAYQQASQQSAVKGQQAAEKMMAHADKVTTTQPVKQKTDDSKLSAEEYAKKHNLKEVW